ncbi:MAG: hypothetical protein GX927_12665, partial [Lentisphaerae bacterium]|nr:hypothetical protein [Lentisphaerota bacterium]
MIVKTSLSFALFFVSAVTLRVMANDEPAIEAQIIKGTVSAAKWIWYPDHRVPFRRGKAEMYCRTKFKLDHPIKAASIRFIADDRGELFINGQQVLEAQTSKVGEYLRQGENIIAFHAVNTDSGFGLIFRLDGTFTTGENFFVVSDHNTKTTAVAEEENWAQLSFNDTGWLDAVEFGDASETPWSLYNNIVEKVGSPEEIAAWRKQKEDAFKLDAAFIKRLNAEPFYPASLTWVNEQPFIQINSCNYPPVLRLGLTPGTVQTDDFIFKMKNSHLKFYEVGTSPPLIRDTNGHLDFEDLEKEVNRILKLSPDAYVVLGFHFATNTIDWCKQNPDEAIGYATGPVQDEDSIPRRNDETRGRRLRPSPASLKFQKFAQECIVDFCEFIKKQPWKNRVNAIRPSFGVSAESMYYGSAYEMPDTGKAMTRQFREFLKKRYKNDDELRQAWHSEKETLENALPPSKEERIGANLFFRNPASCERKVLDYYECMHETMVDFKIGLAETVKKNLPGRLVGIYDGYEVGKFYPPEGEHTLTERLLRSPAIDFLSAPYNYGPDTRWAGKYGIKVHIPSTFTRYRKLSFLEADIRTYVSTLNDGLRHRSPLESVSVIRRDMMHNLFDRDGIQFHQFGGGYSPDWFNTPLLREEIDKSIEVVDFVRKNTFSHSISKIAVIYNSKEFSMHGPRMRVYPFMVELKLINLTSLALSGHIFDLMSLETFLQSKQSYATVVFLNTFTTNPQ